MAHLLGAKIVGRQHRVASRKRGASAAMQNRNALGARRRSQSTTTAPCVLARSHRIVLSNTKRRVGIARAPHFVETDNCARCHRDVMRAATRSHQIDNATTPMAGTIKAACPISSSIAGR
jgi:hypothetical protein